MDKFAVVDKLLLRGACPTPEELSILRDVWDVRRVLSLDGPLGEHIAPACEELDLEHLIVPLTDGNDPNVQILPKVIASLLNGERAYVHCRHGKDRTGMVCAMYRICRGWPLPRALREAYDFGMGKGLSPKVRRSYYRAVTSFAKPSTDVNSSEDIVTKMRDKPAFTFTPAIDNPWVSNYGRMSFAPFLDPQVDAYPPVVSRAAARIYIRSDNLLRPQMWFYGPPSGKGKLYSATISSGSKVEAYKRQFNRTLLQAALVKEPDIIRFIDSVFVVDPNALVDIQEEEDGDSNDALLVGLHDNYTGQAINVFPGSSGYGYDGGVTGPAGYSGLGAAAPIFAPETGLER